MTLHQPLMAARVRHSAVRRTAATKAAGGPWAPGYRPEPRRRLQAYAVGLGLTLLSLMQLWPLRNHTDLALLPGWGRAVLVIAMLELAYVAWIVTVPDWSTLWIAMFAFGTVATAYGVALGVTVMTPRGSSMWLDLDELRDSARGWCTAMVILTVLLTYACGLLATRWRKAYRAEHS